MKSFFYFILGLILIINGILVYSIFSNPYPCQSSCIGCSSIQEYFNDIWTIYFLLISCIIGFVIIFKGFGKIESKGK